MWHIKSAIYPFEQYYTVYSNHAIAFNSYEMLYFYLVFRMKSVNWKLCLSICRAKFPEITQNNHNDNNNKKRTQIHTFGYYFCYALVFVRECECGMPFTHVKWKNNVSLHFSCCFFFSPKLFFCSMLMWTYCWKNRFKCEYNRVKNDTNKWKRIFFIIEKEKKKI